MRRSNHPFRVEPVRRVLRACQCCWQEDTHLCLLVRLVPCSRAMPERRQALAVSVLLGFHEVADGYIGVGRPVGWWVETSCEDVLVRHDGICSLRSPSLLSILVLSYLGRLRPCSHPSNLIFSCPRRRPFPPPERRMSLNTLCKANWNPEILEDPFKGRPVDLTAVSFRQGSMYCLLLTLRVPRPSLVRLSSEAALAFSYPALPHLLYGRTESFANLSAYGHKVQYRSIARV